MATEGQKEAVKTYIEQTKLLVTLASAFLFAPAGLVSILKDRTSLDRGQLGWFIAAEIFFILSVLVGYVVLASLSGSQAANEFNVYRLATQNQLIDSIWRLRSWSRHVYDTSDKNRVVDFSTADQATSFFKT